MFPFAIIKIATFITNNKNIKIIQLPSWFKSMKMILIIVFYYTYYLIQTPRDPLCVIYKI